ncbi:MAG TPA: hypothetical protein VGD99_05450 [Anaerolineae bacterium]|jgi:TolB protein
MTRQDLLKLLVAIAIVILLSGLITQVLPLTAKANPTEPLVQTSELSQIGAATTATQCAECHHSELVSRVDQITTDPSADLRPAWSPDGTQLAFYSGRSGNDDIWIINVDGNSESQLTDDPGRDRRPAWSPDGTKIVFDSNRTGSHDIWIMNADGSEQRQLTTNPGAEMFASFSPDGSQVIFYGYEGGRNEIWTVDIDSGNLHSLTNGLADEQQSQCTFACHTPAFSPDGTSIVFHADEDGSRNIWMMDADGNNLRQLTTTTSGDINNYLPSWSPDGRIIFQAERADAETIYTDIRVIDPDGNNQETLFTEVAHGGPFVWSPDGTRVALPSQRGGAGNFDIFVATFGDVAEKEALEETEVPLEGDESAPAGAEAATPNEVVPSSAEEASPTNVTSPSEFGNTIIVLGVVGLIIMTVVVFSVRRYKRN